MSIEPKDFEFFLNALETHENLLHAETQAIAAKHLDTIESILKKKDESLRLLLEAKDLLGKDPTKNNSADKLIDRVIELQKRNAELFKKLVDRQTAKENSESKIDLKPIDQRLKKAYSKSTHDSNSRLNF